MFLRRICFESVVAALVVGVCATGVVSGLFVSRGVFGLNQIIITGIIAMILFVCTAFFWRAPKQAEEQSISISSSSKTYFFVGLSLFLQLIPLLLMIFARTDQALASPWQAFSHKIFFAYAIAGITFLSMIDRLPVFWTRLLVAVQVLLMTGVSYIVYQLGFGYDPFVHQAAERYLFTHGTISPPSLLYAGHYGVIVFFSRLLHLDPAWLDRALVPLVTPLVFAGLFRISLRAWGGDAIRKVAFFALWLIPCLPLTFTVPHNLTYLLLSVTVLLLPKFQERWFLWIGLWLAVWALWIHPLLGIPIATLVLSTALSQRFPRLASSIAFFLPSVGMLAVFYVYLQRVDGTLLSFQFSRLVQAVTIVFGGPLLPPTISFGWRILYEFYTLWPLFLMIFGVIGLWFLPRERRVFRQILGGAALGVALSALLLAAFVRIPNILPGEQFEFALRLRYALPLFFLPGLFILIDRYVPRTPKKQWIVIILFALLATVVWYGSYPQYNVVMKRSAPGLGRADVQTVQTIEQWSKGKPYVALTSQMISAAALTTLGFEREIVTSVGTRYPYPIPTGGELYQYYLRLWREPDCHRLVADVFQFVPTEQLFVALPQSWDPNRAIEVRLRPCTDRKELIDQTISLYQLRKP